MIDEGVKEKLASLAKKGDFDGLIYALKREGLLQGPALKKGTPVAVRIPGDAQVSIGRVLSSNGSFLWLEDCSWIDHTGEYYSDALEKGGTAQGWSSEYEGTVCIGLGPGIKIHLLPDTVMVPTQSIRPPRS